MNVFYTSAARAESLDAFDYYHERSEQAAGHFMQCLEVATTWISKHHTTGKPLSPRTRRHLMKTFPYLLIYRVEPDAVWIVGVVHEKRDPKYWRHLL